MTNAKPDWLAGAQAAVLAAKANHEAADKPDTSPSLSTVATNSVCGDASFAHQPATPRRQRRTSNCLTEAGEVDPLVPNAAGKVYKKRDYQLNAANDTVTAIIAGARRTLLVSPTGSGKNHITALVLSNQRLRDYFGVAAGEDLRVMYFAHKHELLQQGALEIGTVPGVKLITQSIFSDIPSEVLNEGWHFSIHDEAHHEPMMSFQEKLGYISDDQMLGLTATPERADKFSLKFDEVIVAISRDEAVRLGYLAPATVHSVVDMGAMDKPELLGELVDEYGSRMSRTLIYMKTKDQLYSVHRRLLEKGYRSAALVDVTKKQRDEIKRQFEEGELDYVVNCQMLDEGVDFKGVKGVIIARGVQSGPLLNQIIGRAARIDEPECHIWQFVDPLKDNLDACSIVGRDVDHHLYYIRGGTWHCERMSTAVMVDNSRHVTADEIETETAGAA